jgi:hypothetical protein
MNTELIKQEAAPISMKIRKYVDMIARGAEGGTRISLYNLLGLIDNQISLEEKELIASYAQSLQRPGGSDGWISEAELDAMTKEKDYWYNRCYHAEQFIEKSPCDPDIYDEQIIAHQQWQESKKR